MAENIEPIAADVSEPYTTKPGRNIVATGAIILMIATMVSRLVGLVREWALAHYFGDKWWTDAFVSAFNIPDLIYYLLAGGALGAALIPIVREYVSRDDAEGGHRVTNSLLNIVLLAMLVAGVFAYILAPFLWRFGYDSSDPRYGLTISLTRLLLPQMAIMACSAIFTALLQCHDHFFWPAVGWVVYNIGAIFGTIWLAPMLGGSPQHQIYGVAIGVLIGALLLIGIQMPKLYAVGYRWRPVIEFQNTDFRRVGRAWFPVMLTLAFSYISLQWLPQVLGTQFKEGMVLNIRLAQRFPLLPFGLFGVSIATAAFPTMASLAFKKDYLQLRRTFSSSFSTIMYLIMPSCAALIVLAFPLTQVIWKSGKYSEAGAIANAQMLSFFSFGIVALSTMQLVNRGFFALRQIRTPLIVSGACFAFNLVLCLVLMRTSLSYKGIALGTSISFYLNALILLELLRRSLGGIEGHTILRSFVRVLGATLLMSVVMWAIVSGLHQLAFTGQLHFSTTSRVLALLQVAAACIVAIPVYLIATLALKVPEASLTWAKIRKKLKR
jgi:putative peptidoglycan lipid II flippase